MANLNKVKQLEEIFPIIGIHDGVAISHRGILTLGWELMLPIAYTMEQGEYDNIVQKIFTALQTLPKYYIVHKQDLYLKNSYVADITGKPLRDYNERHFDGRPYMTHTCNLYISRASQLTFLPKTGTCGLLGLSNIRHKVEEEDLSRFRSECNKFITILGDCGIRTRELTDEDWLGTEHKGGVISRAMMLGDTGPVISDVEMNDDFVRVHNKKAQSFIFCDANRLPSEIDNTTKVEALSSHANTIQLSYASKIGILLPFEHIVNQIIMIPDQQKVSGDLNKKLKKLTGGADSQDNAINSQEILDFTEAAYKDSLFGVFAHYNIIVWGEEREQSNISSTVNSAIRSMGIQATYNLYNTPSLWYCGIPGVAAETAAEDCMLMEARSAVHLMSFETFDRTYPDGLLTISDRTRHVPVTIDIQERAKAAGLIGNYNIFMLGPSGSGKSFTTNFIFRNHYEAGEHIFVIDMGDSYQGIIAYINELTGGKDGHYYAYDPAHPFSFNPFQGRKDWGDADNNGYQCPISIIESLWQPAGGWKHENLPILQKIVDDFLELHKDDADDPIFDDFYQYVGDVIRPKILPKLDKNGKVLPKKPEEKLFVSYDEVTPDRFDVSALCRAMMPFSLEGKYRETLNNRQPVDLLNSRAVVFEIEALSKQDKLLYKICVLCILNAFDDKMRRSFDTKMMIIEEAWKALGEDTTASYMSGLWKTARKYNCQAMVVTQQLTDIMSSSVVRDTILLNSDIQILLDQSNSQNNMDETVRLLGLSDKDKNLILSLNKANAGKYKEAFIKWGEKKKAIYAVEVSPQEALLYESAKDKKKPFYDKARELGSIQKAIDFFTQKN